MDRDLSLPQGELPDLRNELLSKTWLSFDLDDTLHGFRRASSVATDAALDAIQSTSHAPTSKLKMAYAKALSQTTSSAFIDGRTSDEYRRERFSAVLQDCAIDASQDRLDHLVRVYKLALAAALRPNPGATELLDLLRSIGKKVVVITEGPEDAQTRTLNQLGISDRIDYLATSNAYRVSKMDGLFSTVLEDLGIQPSDMAYIGDSLHRDIQPATSLGILAIHLVDPLGPGTAASAGAHMKYTP